MTTEPSPSSRFAKWTAEHLPLVLTLSSLALVTLRIGVVAGFEATTGYALIARGSPFVVLVSTLFDLVATLLVALAVALTFLTFRGPEPLKRHMFGPTFTLWMFVVLVVPVDAFLAVAAGAALTAFIRWPMRLIGEDWPSFRWQAMATISFTGMAITALLGGDRPWLPAEVIAIAPDEELVAYVVDTDDRYATLLVHRPRMVRLVPTDLVGKRRICSTGPGGVIWHAPRLPDLLRGEPRPRPPTCPNHEGES